MINFHLPGFYTNYLLNNVFIDYFLTHKDQFYENINIASIYDSFPGCKWNGGRIINFKYSLPTEDNIKNTIKAFNDKNIPCRFTFTNNKIEEEDLNDIIGNFLLQYCNNSINQILVSSEILEEKIRKEFPSYKIVSSTTKNIKDVLLLNKELEKNYFLVVPDIFFNNNFFLLDQINHKEKCEILLNDTCYYNCPNRKEHYEFNGLANKGLVNPCDFHCSYPEIKDQCFYELLETNNSHIKVEDLYNKYIPTGFTNFKIMGRDYSDAMILEFYIYYMVQPQYKDLVRNKIIQELMKTTC